MKKILSAISLSFLFFQFAQAQNDVDAMRYSQTYFGGTAHSMGMAGANGAVGADFSDASNNPAGIGLFRSSEFSITPGLNFLNSNSTYAGQNNPTQRAVDFNISNLGAVFNQKFGRHSDTKWKSVSFAIGANRLADFNNQVYYSGNNANNSLINSYLEELNNSGEAAANVENDYPFDAGLAYATNLITQNSNGTFQSALGNGGVTQSNVITTNGNITEYVLALAANYNDRLYIGASLGIPHIYYNAVSSYSETSIPGSSIAGFNSFNFDNYLTTSGFGVNGKFGLIYRVADFLRLGAAVDSPTYYSLQDQYSSDMTSNLSSGSTSAQSPYGSFNYSLVTPAKFVGSAVLLFKKYAMVSADYEYINYSQAYYSFSSGSTSDEDYQNSVNNTITQKYGPTSNFKIGAEIVLAEIFRIRGGFAMFGSPYTTGNIVPGFDGSTNFYTGGIGIREHRFSLDLGYVHALNHTTQQPYSLAEGETVPTANITNMSDEFLMTLGLRF